MSISFERVDRQPRDSPAAIVARRLIADLLANDLEPGDRLPSERQLAQTLGVGRSAVREALRALALLGLVEIRQSEGTYFIDADGRKPLDTLGWKLLLGTSRARDLVEARAHLIEDIAGLAAARRSRVDGETLERLVAEAALADPGRLVNVDAEFFLTLARAAGNEALARMVGCVSELLRNRLARSFALAGAVDAWQGELSAIATAVEAGDAAAARSAAVAHAVGASGRLLIVTGETANGENAVDSAAAPAPAQ